MKKGKNKIIYKEHNFFQAVTIALKNNWGSMLLALLSAVLTYFILVW